MKIISAVILFCIGLATVVWLITRLIDFVGKQIDIKDRY